MLHGSALQMHLNVYSLVLLVHLIMNIHTYILFHCDGTAEKKLNMKFHVFFFFTLKLI